MIVKEVIKTTFDLQQLVAEPQHMQLSSSVGPHNLTELRRRLE